ncbi:hypothetical protein ABDK00_005395 [Niabella insulamsoli]|uniref:hypothetical protein n=1 Tax=Niabella insulamsoli TaxID=3144874 RepID=UPI0031FBFD93
MKKLILLLLCSGFAIFTMACPVCERNKPKVLRGITHGSPNTEWDYLIVVAVAIITVFTLFFSVKWLLKPGEKNKQHIKYFILKDQ